MDDQLVTGLLIAAILGGITGAIAYNKGESFLGWAIAGFLIAIVMLPWAILMKPNQAALAQREIKAGRAKVCPWCMNLIHPQATVCPHCHQWVVQPPPPYYPPY